MRSFCSAKASHSFQANNCSVFTHSLFENVSLTNYLVYSEYFKTLMFGSYFILAILTVKAKSTKM